MNAANNTLLKRSRPKRILTVRFIGGMLGTSARSNPSHWG
jgi:hypothetical protein